MNIINEASNPNNSSKISQGAKTRENIAQYLGTNEQEAQKQIKEFNKGIGGK